MGLLYKFMNLFENCLILLDFIRNITARLRLKKARVLPCLRHHLLDDGLSIKIIQLFFNQSIFNFLYIRTMRIKYITFRKNQHLVFLCHVHIQTNGHVHFFPRVLDIFFHDSR